MKLSEAIRKGRDLVSGQWRGSPIHYDSEDRTRVKACAIGMAYVGLFGVPEYHPDGYLGTHQACEALLDHLTSSGDRYDLEQLLDNVLEWNDSRQWTIDEILLHLEERDA